MFVGCPIQAKKTKLSNIFIFDPRVVQLQLLYLKVADIYLLY